MLDGHSAGIARVLERALGGYSKRRLEGYSNGNIRVLREYLKGITRVIEGQWKGAGWVFEWH